jgi:predicted molibdopterin-dependent oxidoreductase YjgC
MKKTKIGRTLLLLFTLITFNFTTSGFTNSFGLDSYEIYLNNRLLLKQYVNQPLNLRVLQLEKTQENGQLQIGYTHCMNKGIGTGRSLALKDEAGHLLHKWTFADGSGGSGLKMTIAVKELLQLEKKNAGHELSLYYTAHELEKWEMLSIVRFK